MLNQFVLWNVIFDTLYKLCGAVEMDQAFFSGKNMSKCGGAVKTKTQVTVALQLDKADRYDYLKMQVIPDVTGETLPVFAGQNITVSSAIRSNAFRSCNALSGKLYFVGGNYGICKVLRYWFKFVL